MSNIEWILNKWIHLIVWFFFYWERYAKPYVCIYNLFLQFHFKKIFFSWSSFLFHMSIMVAISHKPFLRSSHSSSYALDHWVIDTDMQLMENPLPALPGPLDAMTIFCFNPMSDTYIYSLVSFSSKVYATFPIWILLPPLWLCPRIMSQFYSAHGLCIFLFLFLG